MKKKLLITSSTFPRWENDNEPRFILDIAKALLVYYDVTVLAPISPGAKEYEILEGIKVVRYHYFPIAYFETLCAPGAIVQRIKEKKWRIFLIPFLGVSLYLYLAKHIKEYDLTIANWIIPQGVIHSLLKSKYSIRSCRLVPSNVIFWEKALIFSSPSGTVVNCSHSSETIS